MPQDDNDFRPKKNDSQGKAPRVFAFVRPDLEIHIDEKETQQRDDVEIVCRCDTVCTCNTVLSGGSRCRCDTVSRCTCQTVRACSCDTVMVCSCDPLRTCTCQSVCSCNRHSSGGGGGRVCRCVPVRAH